MTSDELLQNIKVSEVKYNRLQKQIAGKLFWKRKTTASEYLQRVF